MSRNEKKKIHNFENDNDRKEFALGQINSGDGDVYLTSNNVRVIRRKKIVNVNIVNKCSMIKSDFPAVFAHASRRIAQCYQMVRIKIPAEIFRRTRGSYKNCNSGTLKIRP